MRKVDIEKLTLNIGAGEAGDKLDKSKKILEKLAEKKIIVTRTHKRNTFGVAKGRPTGVKTTLRGEEAKELLKKMFGAIDNKLKPSSFDKQGNFSFGIHEYINIPGVRYDPDIGILGMDVCVTLKRPGFRIKRRSLKKSKISKNHAVSKEDSMNFVKNSFGINITEDEE